MLSYKYNKKISTWSGWPLRGSTWSPTRNNKLKSCLLSAFQEGRHYCRLWYSKFFVFWVTTSQPTFIISLSVLTHRGVLLCLELGMDTPASATTVCDKYCCPGYNSMWQILLSRPQQYMTNIVVQYNAIHQINCCPVDSLIFIGWSVIYSLDSDIQDLNNQGGKYHNIL